MLDALDLPGWRVRARESVGSALEALAGRRARSAMTMAGIVIGVCGVLVIDAVGQSQSAALSAQLAQLGTNLIAVSPRVRGVSAGAARAPTLLPGDADTIKKGVPHVVAVSPTSGAREPAVAGSRHSTPEVTAVFPDYERIESYTMHRGAFFTAQDEASAAAVAVLGQTTVETLFGSTDPLGRHLRLRNVDFRVVGVLDRKGHNGLRDLDDVALVPFSTGRQRLYGASNVNGILVQVDHASNMAPVMDGIVAGLRQAHHLAPAEPNDFRQLNFQQVADAARQQAALLTTVLRYASAIALAIGGFGIMNIMLISVTERTSEVGVRMAVGARPQDVLAQFLIEAATLSMLGCLLGCLLGLGVSAALPHVVRSLAAYPALPSLRAFGEALFVGFFTGVLFGLYPAGRAARLDPIVALRYS